MTITAYLYGYFEDSTNKDGEPGLTVTVDVWQITKSSYAASEVVTGGSATEIGDGLYVYGLASANPLLYDYAAVFKTASTAVTSKHVPALRIDYTENRVTEFGYLDAAVSTLKAVTDKLATTLVLDGAVYQFTANALELAPSGSSTITISGKVTYVGPVATSGDASIVIGDGYYAADGRALEWSSTGWPSLSGATVKFKCNGLDITGTASGTTTQTVSFDVTEAQTATFTEGVDYPFAVIATLATTSHVVTLVTGRLAASNAI